MPNFAPIGQTVAEIWPFAIFKMVAVRKVAFLKVGNFSCPYPPFKWPMSVTVPIFVHIGHAVARCRYMAIFRFFKMASVRHLGFLKVRNFTCRTFWNANMRHHAEFCAGQSSRCGDMAFF